MVGLGLGSVLVHHCGSWYTMSVLPVQNDYYSTEDVTGQDVTKVE